MIEVLTISTSGIACGVSEYFSHLRDASPGDICFRCDPTWLDPEVFFAQLPLIQEYRGPQVVWLNYHAALHSRWTPKRVQQLHFVGFPVVITYHDTGVPNSEQCRLLWQTQQVASGGSQPFIIHEPCEDLPGATYLRQGIPPWEFPMQFDRNAHGTPRPDDDFMYWLGRNNRPILGSVGFPFPWKNYDLLAKATALAGWSLLLLAPQSTQEQILLWRSLNPWTAVVSDFLPATQVVSYLAGCDATAFLYMCANTGTSGAIRQGITARKPVFATSGCRQFRDLEKDWEIGVEAIRWLNDVSPSAVANALMRTVLLRLHPGVHRLAERDSWINQAEKYAEIFRQVTTP